MLASQRNARATAVLTGSSMDRSELPELHYLTAIDNVASILQRGLLSHHRASRVAHRSVAMAAIQERRSAVRVPGGARLHDYVNLYINGRNPMMFTVVHNHSVDELCLLRVSCDVLDLPGVVIADCNASSDYVRFASAQRGLALIDTAEVTARYWMHADPIDQMRHKSRMCAEVLVPHAVDPRFVVGAYVGSDAAADNLHAVASHLDVTRDGYKFFG
jgi:hypothetical protein